MSIYHLVLIIGFIVVAQSWGNFILYDTEEHSKTVQTLTPDITQTPSLLLQSKRDSHLYLSK